MFLSKSPAKMRNFALCNLLTYSDIFKASINGNVKTIKAAFNSPYCKDYKELQKIYIDIIDEAYNNNKAVIDNIINSNNSYYIIENKKCVNGCGFSIADFNISKIITCEHIYDLITSSNKEEKVVHKIIWVLRFYIHDVITYLEDITNEYNRLLKIAKINKNTI